MEWLSEKSTLVDGSWRPKGSWHEGNLESNNFTIPKDRFIIVRLDGKNFHKVTKDMDKPYDKEFMGHMEDITESLVYSPDFRVIAGYTQSDEISLLIDRNDDSFGRKHYKILSVLAGHASGYLSRAMGRAVIMDARVFWNSGYPHVFEYFWSRVNDCYRNFVNASMYWKLRESMNGTKASKTAEGMNMETMKTMLKDIFQEDIDERPGREQFGSLYIWKTYMKDGYNPKANKPVRVERRIVEKVDLISREHLINRLDVVMHIHHVEKGKCIACTYQVPYCDYCRNSHTKGEFE